MIIIVKVRKTFCMIKAIIFWIPTMYQIHITHKPCCSNKLIRLLAPYPKVDIKRGSERLNDLPKIIWPMCDIFHSWTNSKVCVLFPSCHTAPAHSCELQELILSYERGSFQFCLNISRNGTVHYFARQLCGYEHRLLRPAKSRLWTAVSLLPSCTTFNKSTSLSNSFLTYKMGLKRTHVTRLLWGLNVRGCLQSA